MALNEMSKIEKAKDIAMQAHLGQTRKVSKEPYFIHPFRVFLAARTFGFNKEHQLLAILHDVYEDAKNKKYVLNQIKEYFGGNMVKLVLVLSHDKSISDYDNYVLTLAKKNKTALHIKLLDMLENLKDNPSKRQLEKYYKAIKHLLDNNINIDTKLLSIFKKINKSDIYI